MSTDLQERSETSDDREARRAPAGVASLTGVLAVAAAIGAGHLVGGLIDPAASPVLAVGGAFIDRTPVWLKDFAVSSFGTEDKTVLLAGMGAVLVVVGALLGLLARRDLRLGVAGTGVVGVVGLAAVLTRPDVGGAGVLAPLVAIGVGVATLVWLHRAAATSWPRVTPRTRRGTPLTVSRRGFFATSAAVTAGAAGAALVGSGLGRQQVDIAAAQQQVGTRTPVQPVAPVPVGADFISDGGLPFTTANADFYRIDTALSPPRVSVADWRLRIHGMVDREMTLTFDELVARKLVERRVTFTCVSYELGSDLVGTATWTGVDLRALLTEVGVSGGADQIFSTSVDGFSASTPVATVMEPDRGAMLAVNMNGAPLPVEHGFPVRMLVPGLYGFVSATKWITDIELTTFAAKQAYWTPRGWSDHGPVKMASKIVSGSAKPAGAAFTATVTGAAWATHVGIAKVEVQVDGGGWRPARLGADAGRDTWRMFRIDLPGLSRGQHRVQCRATDVTGRVQTQIQAPPDPDGATGWHQVRLNVG